MAAWSIEEQAISVQDVPNLTTLNMRIESGDTSIMRLELMQADGGGWLLRFNRNGAFINAQKVEPPATEGGATEEEGTRSTSHGRRR